MQIKNTYPETTRSTRNRRKLLTVLRWPFIISALASLIVNLVIGGPLWSIIVIFSLYAIWDMILSPDLIEYNRTSQSVKTLFFSITLLALIDIFIVKILAPFVIPIVCFGGLAVCDVLFFSNMEKQKHNMMYLLNFIFLSIIGSSLALWLGKDVQKWPYIVLLGLSVTSLLALIIVLKQDFKLEFKRRFHIK